MMTSDDYASDHPCQPASAQDEQGADTPDAADAGAPGSPSSPWGEGGAAALEAENAELKDRLLRTLADMENLRRRAEREREETRKYAMTSFARDMLNVGDNMARALQSLDDSARETANDVIKALIEGVDITQRELENVFQRHGIERLSPIGEKFDPNFHQAMFEVENPDVVAGTVIQVVQDGYRIGDRVLRPAMVGVSKGGPKGAPTPRTEQADQAAGADAAPDAGGDGQAGEAQAAARSHEEAASAKAAGGQGKTVDRSA